MVLVIGFPLCSVNLSFYVNQTPLQHFAQQGKHLGLDGLFWGVVIALKRLTQILYSYRCSQPLPNGGTYFIEIVIKPVSRIHHHHFAIYIRPQQG